MIGDASMTTSTQPTARSARYLLDAGVVAGPLFVVVGLAQALTRDGFDLSHQPLSLLSLGDLGWIQITNFVVAGLLCLAFAVGVARTITSGPASTWAPRLFGVFGAGMVLGGVFVPDPALGYPPGTPDEIPDSMSAHAAAHAVAPVIAFVALVAVCFVVARRFSAEGRSRAALVTRIVAVVALVLSIPAGPSPSLQLFIAVTLGFAWITALALHLRNN